MSTEGTDPFATVDYRLVPERTAVIVIDCQNDVLHEQGQYAKKGVDTSHMRRVVDPIKQLVEGCRTVGFPIIWTRHGFKNETDAGILLPLRPFLREGGFRQGTWGYQILDEFDVQEHDWIIDKNRFSCFYGTNLNVVLRGLGTDVLLVAGVLTNQCVSATARDAFHRDIKPIVVEDCTGTTIPELHEPALRMVTVGFGAVKGLDALRQEIDEMQATSTAEPAVVRP